MSAFPHYPHQLYFCINTYIYTALADMTQKNKYAYSHAALMHRNLYSTSMLVSLSEPCLTGIRQNDRTRGTNKEFLCIYQKHGSLWSAVFKAWLTRFVVCILAKARGALPNTQATELPGVDLNKCFWNHCFLVSLLKELKDDTVAVLVLDVRCGDRNEGHRYKRFKVANVAAWMMIWI